MPTVIASHVVLDVPTLFAVTLFITVIGGLLLLFAFLQNRNTPALALWGIGYLVGAAGAALLAGQAAVPNSWSVCGANALLCAAYGFMWSGARSFEGRRVSVALLAAGPALWIGAFQFESFAQSMQARISLVAAISACYAVLAARELWYARDRDLISRWPTLVLVVGHAGFLLARIPYAEALASSVTSGHAHGAVVTVMAFEALFVAFCLPFLRVAMSKERTELEQRQAAETDPLTGIPNRRAFFDRGNPLIERFIAERQPAALLLFDLDRFKDVNDTAGHQAGDRVLQAFCDLVGASNSARRPVRPAGWRGIRLSDGERNHDASLAERRAAARRICSGEFRRAHDQAHGERRRRDGERSRPEFVGAAGARRPGALPGQGRRAQSCHAGAARCGRYDRRNRAPSCRKIRRDGLTVAG